jgi:regulator of RNase E activity RraA
MTEPIFSEVTRQKLARCSSATLTTQLFKRGLRNVFIQNVTRLTRLTCDPPAMVGEAYTLRNIPSREDLDHVGVFDNPDHPQRKAFETCPPGHVLVIDCRGERRVASGGAILLTRLQVRAAAGLVSDGALRDSAEIAQMNFPVYCAGAAAPLNLVHHHAVDINVPIACGGVAVYPGDIMVGDAEGVVVIPRHLAAEVADDAAEQEVLEEFILAEIKLGASLPGTYPPNEATKARYAQWKKTRDA